MNVLFLILLFSSWCFAVGDVKVNTGGIGSIVVSGGGTGSILAISSPPAGGYATAITEDWDCSNADPLTCDLTWTEFGAGEVDIVSNKASSVVSNGDPGTAKVANDLGSANQCAQADFTINGNSNNRIYANILLRVDSAGNNWYFAGVRDDSFASNNVRIFKKVSNSDTQLASGSYSLTNGQAYTVKFCANGEALELFVNGASQLSTTDSAISSGGITGIELRDNSGSTVVTADNFEAGPIE